MTPKYPRYQTYDKDQTSSGQFLQIFGYRALSRGWLVKEETSAAKWPQQIKGNLGEFFTAGIGATLESLEPAKLCKTPQSQIPFYKKV